VESQRFDPEFDGDRKQRVRATADGEGCLVQSGGELRRIERNFDRCRCDAGLLRKLTQL